MRLQWRDPDAAPAGRVTAVETFFDVVFVFTLTQLTKTLGAEVGPLRRHGGLLHFRAGKPSRLRRYRDSVRSRLPGRDLPAPDSVHAGRRDPGRQRRALSIGSPATRLVAAVVVLASVPIGALASAGLHLASVLGIVVVMLWTTALPGRH